jgi:hypothetical protein
LELPEGGFSHRIWALHRVRTHAHGACQSKRVVQTLGLYLE